MDMMHYFTPKSNTFYICADCHVRQALETFARHKFSVVPVVESDGTFISTISEGDLLRYIHTVPDLCITDETDVPIAQIEKYRPYRALNLRASMETILRLSLDQNFIPLVDDRNCYIGILKRKAIIEYLYRTNSNYVFGK